MAVISRLYLKEVGPFFLLPFAPFGIKYHYGKNVGGYVNYRYGTWASDPFHFLTGGISYSFGKLVPYIGGGLNYIDPFINYVAEIGSLLKIGRITFDLGIGYISESFNKGYFALGLGYSF